MTSPSMLKILQLFLSHPVTWLFVRMVGVLRLLFVWDVWSIFLLLDVGRTFFFLENYQSVECQTENVFLNNHAGFQMENPGEVVKRSSQVDALDCQKDFTIVGKDNEYQKEVVIVERIKRKSQLPEFQANSVGCQTDFESSRPGSLTSSLDDGYSTPTDDVGFASVTDSAIVSADVLLNSKDVIHRRADSLDSGMQTDIMVCKIEEHYVQTCLVDDGDSILEACRFYDNAALPEDDPEIDFDVNDALCGEMETIRGELRDIVQQRMLLETAETSARAQIEVLQKALEQERKDLDTLRNELSSQLHNKDSKLVLFEERIDRDIRDIQQLEQDLKQSRLQSDVKDNKLEDLGEELEEWKAKVDELQHEVERMKETSRIHQSFLNRPTTDRATSPDHSFEAIRIPEKTSRGTSTDPIIPTKTISISVMTDPTESDTSKSVTKDLATVPFTPQRTPLHRPPGFVPPVRIVYNSNNGQEIPYSSYYQPYVSLLGRSPTAVVPPVPSLQNFPGSIIRSYNNNLSISRPDVSAVRQVIPPSNIGSIYATRDSFIASTVKQATAQYIPANHHDGRLPSVPVTPLFVKRKLAQLNSSGVKQSFRKRTQFSGNHLINVNAQSVAQKPAVITTTQAAAGFPHVISEFGQKRPPSRIPTRAPANWKHPQEEKSVKPTTAFPYHAAEFTFHPTNVIPAAGGAAINRKPGMGHPGPNQINKAVPGDCKQQ